MRLVARRKHLVLAAVLVPVVWVAGCLRTSAETERAPAPSGLAATPAPERSVIRATGLVRALEWQGIRVPQLSKINRFTLIRLIPNGRTVAKGDLLAEFDRTTLLDDERDAKAKLDDLEHQLEEKRAQVKSDAAKRISQLKEAEADLAKAALQIRKGPVLSEIDRLKNEARAENAKERVASLKKSGELRNRAEQAAVAILELKVKRQQVVLERIRTNLERLVIRAPQDGMVAIENTWREGSMGPAQEGDQMWPGMPLLRIFNPAEMVVEATISEADFAALSKPTRARLFLDAYPGVAFDSELESASPVATAGMESPVRTFGAVFRITQRSSQLLPDLSAALEIEIPRPPAATVANAKVGP